MADAGADRLKERSISAQPWAPATEVDLKTQEGCPNFNEAASPPPFPSDQHCLVAS
jgi:hypothetical protein